MLLARTVHPGPGLLAADLYYCSQGALLLHPWACQNLCCLPCRFSANFFVTDPTFNLQFYAAAPLIASNGHRLGTL